MLNSVKYKSKLKIVMISLNISVLISYKCHNSKLKVAVIKDLQLEIHFQKHVGNKSSS